MSDMARRFVMEFERPLEELEEKLVSLKRVHVSEDPELAAQIAELETEIGRLHETLYTVLTPWERVQISRHPERPKTDDYLSALFTDVMEVHGDRLYGDDEAMFAGFATLGGRRVVVLAHRKGKGTHENVRRNFGSPHPEGFRKAKRLMRLADRFGLPIVTLLDTAGAYPGIEAEDRGQALAIAECLATLSRVRVPVVVVGIGEGGSGGALAIGFGDRLVMLENAYYSVISPEMCATILHKDAGRASETSACLQLTAEDLLRLGLADEVVPEPLGGAHRDPEAVFAAVRPVIERALDELCAIGPDALVAARYEHLRAIGVYAAE
jgi:acetyl-CoA carboxylase carboxyl transferase subunit alpha